MSTLLKQYRTSACLFGACMVSRDHKQVALCFLFPAFLWACVGGLLAVVISWQNAWPWSNIPVIGTILFPSEGGQITPEFYAATVLQLATVVVFFVVLPILISGLGGYVLPLMLGSEGMAFPTLHAASSWLMWPAYVCVAASFVMPPYCVGSDWMVDLSNWLGGSGLPGSELAQLACGLALPFVGASLLLSSVSHLTTIMQMRAPGLRLERLPMTVWGQLFAAVASIVSLPILAAAAILNALPHSPESTELSRASIEQLVVPALLLAVLPVLGVVADVITTFARKPLAGYVPSVVGLGMVAVCVPVQSVLSILDQRSGESLASFVAGVPFVVLAIGLAVNVFVWLKTLFRSRPTWSSPMLFAFGVLWMFGLGGGQQLAGYVLPKALVALDRTRVAWPFDWLLAIVVLFGGLAGLCFWFPKVFGRQMNEFWGKVHFVLTFVLASVLFFPSRGTTWSPIQAKLSAPFGGFASFGSTWSQWVALSVLGLVAVQVVFLLNFFGSALWGNRVGRNPWQSNTLEWATASPPGPGNFDFQPEVVRWPYEYTEGRHSLDCCSQAMSPACFTNHGDESIGRMDG